MLLTGRLPWLLAGFMLVSGSWAATMAASAKSNHASIQPWVKLEGCNLLTKQYFDGDNFHARWGTNEFIFRLYFVDAPETDDSFPERNREQSAYFGITLAENARAAKEAKAFVQEHLRQPFVVWTRWNNAMGRSNLPRYFAHVEVRGKSLAEVLVSRGLARAKGVIANLPSGQRAKSYMDKLQTLERDARVKRVGIWKHSSAPLPK